MPQRKVAKAEYLSPTLPPPSAPPVETMGEAAIKWRMRPEVWLPSNWKGAKQTNMSVPLPRYAADIISPESSGQYTSGLRDPQIQLQPTDNPEAQGETAVHEYGHAGYHQDLSEQDRQNWTKLHDSWASKIKVDPTTGSDILTDVPPSIGVYPTKPAESFAATFSVYVRNPNFLKKFYPDVYDYFYKLFHGLDYSKPYRGQK
jgi:hypothetical protein